MALYDFGTTMIGTALHDLMIGNFQTTLASGEDGADIILGDLSVLNHIGSSSSNGNINSAFSFDDNSFWRTDENPLIANPNIPHTTAFVDATPGQSEYFRVSLLAGQTLTVDVDSGGGNIFDTIAEVQNSAGGILGQDDDSIVTEGGYGSRAVSGNLTRDPFLTYTAPADGVYYINIRPFSGTTFAENYTFMLNLSVTGHAATANVFGSDDNLSGGNGDDQLFGVEGSDYLDGGAGADVLLGGTGDDILRGGADADLLNGGKGADYMRGDGGDDDYTVDNVGDLVVEGSGGGTDSVTSTVSFKLGSDVENLRLLGTAAINGTGNSAANTIKGNNAANTLTGGSGTDLVQGAAGADTVAGNAGNDTLYGGSGADKFLFNAALSSSSNVDNVKDFSVADDTLVLDRSVFAGLPSLGALSSARFHNGAAAHDSDDRIIYDSATGNIYYDADGNGGGSAQVLFAHVAAGLALTAADFLIVA